MAGLPQAGQNPSPLRSLPRLFVPGADPSAPIPIPAPELDKLRKVLRLGTGDWVAILPNDGSIVRCQIQRSQAIPEDVHWPETEPIRQLTLIQALPKGDKLDEIVRACTEIGVVRFVLFSSERTVVRWDPNKLQVRIGRLETIAREAAEVSFRTRLPAFEVVADLASAFDRFPNAWVLSELDGTNRELASIEQQDVALIVGPEGGWSPLESERIGERGVTLGPRILRVEHAGPAAVACLLLRGQTPSR
jgi:16S rRNA (uracil1498-N3)-methyltransferase